MHKFIKIPHPSRIPPSKVVQGNPGTQQNNQKFLVYPSTHDFT